MDSNIRQLLAAAQQFGVQGDGSFLHQAYDLLKSAAEAKPNPDGPLPFNQDLYVLCAELALQNGLPHITKESLKMFFMKTPPANQFLCRAYLCQAQLLAPTSANDSAQLEKAVVYILKAINFAKENTRYHFLVYNASVLYWQFCRPFLKPNFRQFLSVSLHHVVKALDDIEDKDYEWRAQLMLALIECHVDAGRTKEAAEVSKATSEFTKTHVPLMYKQVIALQVRHQLVDMNKLAKDLKPSGELSVYFKLMRLRVACEQGEVTEPAPHLERILKNIVHDEDFSRSSSSMSVASGRKTATPSQPEEKSKPTAPSSQGAVDGREEGASSPSISSVFRLASTASEVKSLVSKWKAAPVGPVARDKKAPLLMDLARLCAEHNLPDLLARTLDAMKNFPLKDKGTFFEMEFLQCELMVRNLLDKQEVYSKNTVEVRLHAIDRLSEAVMNAVRHGDPNVIQAGCVTLWNLCLPLLQTNLRSQVRKPLTLVAESLENIDSLLILLRCQLHTELAKCEEDVEQIQVAMEHLRKALSLDDGGQYRERLETALHRLDLRAELYKLPERLEDQAAMIIEQARTSSDSGTVLMKRSLLVKAGQALSPDAFMLVLESEREPKAGGRGADSIIAQLGAKARNYKKSTKKANGHIKRIASENERERARLWGDLAKTARKQEVWDICRVASRFCLLYDDDRWSKPASPTRPETRQDNASVASDHHPTAETPTGRKKSSMAMVAEPTMGLSDKDLVRMLAEVHFLNSEALIHLLRSEGVEMYNKPIPPVDKRKHPKGYVAKKPEEDPDWLDYCDFIKDLAESATGGFLRAAELGVTLGESWIVCSAAAYLWNYTNHMMTDNRHRELIAPFTSLLQALKQVGHSSETVLLVNLCNALALGLIIPWIPLGDPEPENQAPSAPRGKGAKDPDPSPRKAKSVASHTSGKSKLVLTVDPEGGNDIKQALEVCDYALEVTNGSRPLDLVPIAIRHPLLITWVRVKQLSSSQIHKSLGCEDENNMDGQRPLTRCMIALEMLTLNGNGIMDFKDAPSLNDLSNMVEQCQWPDPSVELQVWSRLTYLAYKARNHSLVMRCASKATAFEEVPIRHRKLDEHKLMVWYEMLSYASCVLGQSHVRSMEGNNAVRRAAMEAFLHSARYGRKANNYDLVITAARRYWNACLMLISEPMERQLLKEPLTAILECINATYKKDTKVKSEDDEGTEDGTVTPRTVTSIATSQPQPVVDILSDPEDDLTLRAAIYGVLFQAYADQGEWEAALAAMDKAVNDMPRTRHRLLIFKHRLMVKAQLGRDIHVDIAKFRDESEDYVALMWYKVAKCSKDQFEQLTAYQNAVEALRSSSTNWQKVEYLVEFAEWLYLNEFPLQDCQDQLEWAVDILLSMRIRTRSAKKSATSEKSRKKRGKRSSKVGSPTPGQNQQNLPQSPTLTDNKTTEAKAESEADGMDAARYIPIKKESIIGLSASSLDLTAEEITSAKILEHLVRIHTMLAVVAGRGSEAHRNYCLLAWGFLTRLMQVSISSAGQVAKELAKAAAAADQAPGKGSAKGKKGGADKGKGGKEAEPAKEKPKRKGPIDAVPSSPEDWAGYDVPEEIREAFKHDPSGESINKESIVKPTLTLYYLETLVAELRAANYNHLVFPALNMAEVIARDLVLSETCAKTYRLIAAEVCWEMNLPAAAKFHEAEVGPTVLSQDEQAKSRDEIAQLRERQVQVKREASRLEEMKRAMTGQQKTRTVRTFIPPDQKTDIVEAVKGFRKSLSALTFRQAWTQQAEILIKQGYYQSARELLNEAYLSAQAFEDTWTQAHILLNLARLAISDEANFGQAINLLKEAQTLETDEMFWLDTTLLMVEAYLGDIEDRERNNKARALLMKSLATFTVLAEQRPNKAGLISYIKATLEAKYASIQVNQVLHETRDTMQPKAHRELQTACQKFEHSAQEMSQAGYQKEAVQIMQQHANILRLFACDSHDKELQHKFLLEAFTLMKKVVVTADELLMHTLTLFSVPDMRNVSLPVQREACAAKLTLSELLIDMLAIFTEENRVYRVAESRKSSLEKLVEEFIAATPVMTDVARDWKDLTSTMASQALSQLTSALTLANSIATLRAKALYNLGRCLRMLGIQRGPSAPNQWDVQFMNLVSATTGTTNKTAAPPPPADGEEEAEAPPEAEKKEEEPSPQEIRQAENIQKMVNQYRTEQTASELYLSQATEVLAQSVQLALQAGLKEIVRSASMDIIEASGQYDQGMASQYLALYQSCQASVALEDTLSRAQIDPTTSRQANLLHQRHQILAGDIASNQGVGTIMKTAVGTLDAESEAWKRLAIAPNHLDLLKELPPNFNIIILQHTDDRSILYGALLDKPKASGGKEGGRSKGGSSQVSRAKVTRSLVEPSALENLCYRFRQHKQEVMSILLKAEYKRSQQAQRQRMLENLSDDMKEVVKDLSDDLAEAEQKLQEQFVVLLASLEDYLRPITSYLEPAVRAFTTQGGQPAGRDAAGQPQDESIIILADQWLLELPLEALAIFSSPAIGALTRDFSLQMLYNRFYREPEEEMSEEKKKKEAAKAKAAKEKNKGVKVVPLDRPVPPGCLPLDTHSFKYIVDPHNDSPESEEYSPIRVAKEALQLYMSQFTARWEGLMGDDHVPSLGEIEEQMTDCNAFVFYGLEKFFSHIPPFKVAPLNLSEISLAVVLDLVQTNQSFMRQSKIDVEKSNTDLSLEKPVETAMLLSLAGVGCVMANQWHCKLAENACTFNTLMKGMLEVGRTSGQTVRRMFIPYYKAPGEEEEEGEGDGAGEGGEEAGGGEKEGKTGTPSQAKGGGAKKDKEKASAKGAKGGKAEETKKDKGKKSAPPSAQAQAAGQGSSGTGQEVKGKDGQQQQGPENQLELINRGWFNFVCYGLPNLMVTQV
ncbi:cilia- and flagella-associated protein 46-like [Diadema setosum]|uniref:cilia- and flagella-associated protein 46-like n=1 Tax=Diadema setosum TaxID=31175 RepID=UPI003B3AD191